LPEDPAEIPAFLEAAGYFETVTFSDDDRQRAQMYQEEAQRTTLQAGAKNISEYLASLEMKIICRTFDPQHMARIAQLLQRSNQFNLRTQRFSQGQCERFMAQPDLFPSFYVKLRDRVGDYGLISVVCTQRAADVLDITEYVMSCRVLNRGVEQYVMRFLVEYCRAHGLGKIRGEFITSEKNKMVAQFYAQFGFVATTSTATQSVWELTVADYVAPTIFIQPDEA
jgi:FkbH-like protein